MVIIYIEYSGPHSGKHFPNMVIKISNIRDPIVLSLQGELHFSTPYEFLVGQRWRLSLDSVALRDLGVSPLPFPLGGTLTRTAIPCSQLNLPVNLSLTCDVIPRDSIVCRVLNFKTRQGSSGFKLLTYEPTYKMSSVTLMKILCKLMIHKNKSTVPKKMETGTFTHKY